MVRWARWEGLVEGSSDEHRRRIKERWKERNRTRCFCKVVTVQAKSTSIETCIETLMEEIQDGTSSVYLETCNP